MDSTLLKGILTLISIIGLLLFSMKDSWGKKAIPNSERVQ